MRKNLSRTEIDIADGTQQLLFTAGPLGCLITSATLKDATLLKEVPGFTTPITYVGDVVGEIVAPGERLVALATAANAAAAVSVYGAFDVTHFIVGNTLHVHESVTLSMRGAVAGRVLTFGNIVVNLTTAFADYVVRPGRYTSAASPVLQNNGSIVW